jgi:hypothetical protein
MRRRLVQVPAPRSGFAGFPLASESPLGLEPTASLLSHTATQIYYYLWRGVAAVYCGSGGLSETRWPDRAARYFSVFFEGSGDTPRLIHG